MNPSERNAFVVRNYGAFSNLCRTASYQVQRKFPKLMLDDLMGYALEGGLRGIDRLKGDLSNWMRFVYKYCYLAAMSGAMEMIGIIRCRADGKSRFVEIPIIFERSDNFAIYERYLSQMDANPGDDMIDNIHFVDEIVWFQECLGNSFESHLFKLIAKGVSLNQIAEMNHLSRRQLKRYEDKLFKIYQLASTRLPYKHMLSDRDTRRIRICTVHSTRPNYPKYMNEASAHHSLRSRGRAIKIFHANRTNLLQNNIMYRNNNE